MRGTDEYDCLVAAVNEKVPANEVDEGKHVKPIA